MTSANPFDFFDKIYCIHLPDCVDRWEQLSVVFEEVGILDRVVPISVSRPGKHCHMPSLTYPVGELGAWLSHNKALVHAIASGAENVLFLEDDVFFVDDIKARLATALEQLPLDWDIFFLTGSPRTTLHKVSNNIASISGLFHGAVAYALPKRNLLEFYDFKMELLQNLKTLADSGTNHYAQRNNGYVVVPPICLTQPGPSEVRNLCHRDYNKNVLRHFAKHLGLLTINVVCLKWGTLYSADYVNRLYYGFKRHSTVNFVFHCFTDDSTGIDDDIVVHSLPNTGLKTWWNKLYLFNNDAFDIKGRIVYCDLDNVIVGNMDGILEFDGPFASINVFHHTKTFNKTGSGLLSWEAGKHNHIWENFLQNKQAIIKKHMGDQDWIHEQMEGEQVWWQDVLPGQVKSYIFDCVDVLPHDARIVCYEGPIKIEESIKSGIQYPRGAYKNRAFNRPPQQFIIDNWKDDNPTGKPMRRMIYQVKVGPTPPKFYDTCIASVKRYCDKYGIDHILLTEPKLTIRPVKSCRSVKAVERLGYLPIFEKENAFEYLDEYDQICIVDSDIYIRDEAPNIFDQLHTDTDFAGVLECDMPLTPEYTKKIRQYSGGQYSTLTDVDWPVRKPFGYEFYNMGLMLFNSSIKEYLNGQTPEEFIKRKEFERFVNGEGSWKWSTDQTLLNYWVRESGMTLQYLDWKWNTLFKGVTDDVLPQSHFIHFFLSAHLPKGGEEIPQIVGDLSKASEIAGRR